MRCGVQQSTTYYDTQTIGNEVEGLNTGLDI